MKRKIEGGGTLHLNFSFMCKEVMQDPAVKNLVIKIRGGAPILLDFFAKTSIP